MSLDKRWLPALVTPTLVAAIVIAAPIQANAVNLPDLTASEVMALMGNSSTVNGFSGTVIKTTNLGLPALELSFMMTDGMVDEMSERMPDGFEDFVPQILEESYLTEAVAFIAGTHKMRLYASEDGMRAQILDMMGQRDIIVTEDTLTLYNFDKNTYTVINLTDLAPEITEEDKAAWQAQAEEMLLKAAAELQLDLSNPAAVADYLLAEASETANITVGTDHRLAGRTAYQLIATPKTEHSLIESIVVSVDSETGFVLDTKVYSVEQEEPALHVGFTDISFVVPDTSLFNLSAPPGAIVNNVDVKEELSNLKGLIETTYPEEIATLEGTFSSYSKEQLMVNAKTRLENLTDTEKADMRTQAETAFNELATRYLIGENWDTVVKLDNAADQLPSEILDNPVFEGLIKPVPGGKAFSTPLLNIVILDTGDIYLGAVTLEYLLSAVN